MDDDAMFCTTPRIELSPAVGLQRYWPWLKMPVAAAHHLPRQFSNQARQPFRTFSIQPFASHHPKPHREAVMPLQFKNPVTTLALFAVPLHRGVFVRFTDKVHVRIGRHGRGWLIRARHAGRT